MVEASRFAQVRSPAEIPTQLTVHHPCARRHIFPVESRSRRYRCLWESPACCESAPSGGKVTLDPRPDTGHTGISRPGGTQQGGKMGLRDHTDPTASLSRDPGGLVHVYGELCLSAHDTVAKDRRSVLGFAEPQRNEGVATAVCGAGHVNMSKDLAKCPPELVVSGQEQSKRLRPTGRKPGVVVGHGYAGAARRRRGAKGCSGSRVARGATRTRGLASASDSRASRHVHKSYELLACNAAWREGAAPSSTSSGSGSARRSARVEVPQGTQNKFSARVAQYYLLVI